MRAAARPIPAMAFAWASPRGRGLAGVGGAINVTLNGSIGRDPTSNIGGCTTGITVNKYGKVRRAKLYYLRALTGKKARIKERRVVK